MDKAERSKDILENFKRCEQRSFSVFVDYLTHRVNFQWLWSVFSRMGQVVDVYISRKIRKNNPTRFAFVRFEFRNHASRAIQLLNGSLLDGKTIAVSESKYGRREADSGFKKYRKNPVVGLEINHNESNDNDVSKAEYFDVVKPFCGFSWSISRRVWLEVMGLPIHVWSEDTFVRLAKGLDGRLIKQHVLTEEGASFSVARILIDYYQWEPIQEWISVICEDAIFDVYVKECGGEVLSLQVHPEDSVQTSGSCSTCRDQEPREEAAENSPEKEETMLEKKGDNVTVSKDPLMENIINGSWKFEQACVLEQVWGGIKLRTSVNEDMLDPMEIEAQIKPHTSQDCWGLRALFAENGDVDESQSSTSCPFPPGYGPCTKENHVHKDIQTGGNSLDEESDDVLLKNLISKRYSKKAKGSRPKKAKAPQRILLGPAKRIFRSRVGTCKDGVKVHRDMSNKENEGPTTQHRNQNKSQDKGKRTDCIEEHVESERLDDDVEKAKEAINVCKAAGMIFDGVDLDMVIRDFIAIS